MKYNFDLNNLAIVCELGHKNTHRNMSSILYNLNLMENASGVPVVLAYT